MIHVLLSRIPAAPVVPLLLLNSFEPLIFEFDPAFANLDRQLSIGDFKKWLTFEPPKFEVLG